ncbi:MAG: hypothetical protein C4291_06600 [Candidatus Dadabacteria bacterium]
MRWRLTIPNIDATGISTSATALTGGGNSVGITLCSFWLNGPINTTSTGINLGAFGSGALIRDLIVFYFGIGIRLDFTQMVRLEGNNLQQSQRYDLYINGGSGITTIGNLFANAASTGTNPGGANVAISGGAFGIAIYDSVIDEAFSSGSSSIYIGNASDIRISNSLIYFVSGGYGISIGDGTNNPTRVSLTNIRIGPFAGNRVPINTIRIYGSGHVLKNVTTNPNGGGDIRDNTNDSVYINVNYKTLLSGGLQQLPVNPKPACNSDTVGTTWFTPGATGVKDTYEICAKDATNNYAWRTLY